MSPHIVFILLVRISKIVSFSKGANKSISAAGGILLRSMYHSVRNVVSEKVCLISVFAFRCVKGGGVLRSGREEGKI